MPPADERFVLDVTLLTGCGTQSRLGLSSAPWAQRKLGGVGFNPYRPQRRRQSDYVLVAAAAVVVVLLLAWALFG